MQWPWCGLNPRPLISSLAQLHCLESKNKNHSEAIVFFFGGGGGGGEGMKQLGK